MSTILRCCPCFNKDDTSDEEPLIPEPINDERSSPSNRSIDSCSTSSSECSISSQEESLHSKNSDSEDDENKENNEVRQYYNRIIISGNEQRANTTLDEFQVRNEQFREKILKFRVNQQNFPELILYNLPKSNLDENSNITKPNNLQNYKFQKTTNTENFKVSNQVE